MLCGFSSKRELGPGKLARIVGIGNLVEKSRQVYFFWKKFFKHGGFKKYGYGWMLKRDGLKKVKTNIRTREGNLSNRKRCGSFIGNKKSIKVALVRLYGSRCLACNLYFPTEKLTIDHIKRIRDGGTNKLDNLQLLCRECHDLKDFEMKDFDINRQKSRGSYPFRDAFERVGIYNQK